MPHNHAMIPADRFFARLDKFVCECPSCGELLCAEEERHGRKRSLRTMSQRRSDARENPGVPAIWTLRWNPYTQRLWCPWCRNSFVAGLMLYPMKLGGPRPTSAPPDTIPTKRQLLALRRQAGGFFAEQVFHRGDEVNLVIDADCTCPEGEYNPRCLIHAVQRPENPT